MTRLAAYMLLFACSFVFVPAANGQPAPGAIRPAPRNPHEPGWARPIFTTEAQQELIEATPIHMRPYRPLHFYGNTVRRQYYRGTAMPSPRDAADWGAALIGRRGHVEDYVGHAGR
jgi:hypothetical protein